MSRRSASTTATRIGMTKPVARRSASARSPICRASRAALRLQQRVHDRADGWPGAARRLRSAADRACAAWTTTSPIAALGAGEHRRDRPLHDRRRDRLLRPRVLEDDRHHFPPYEAVLLYRADLAARARGGRGVRAARGRIDAEAMTAPERARQARPRTREGRGGRFPAPGASASTRPITEDGLGAPPRAPHRAST